MSTIQDLVTIPATSAAASSASAAASSVQSATQNFLSLLVTQLQNQDPLNPLDNAQLTTQLAQLNMVSGINGLNDTLNTMAASNAATQTLQGAALIGRGVMVSGSATTLSGGQALLGVALPQAVDKLVVTIRDAAGNVVHRVDAGPQAAGIVGLSWDGATDAGSTAADGQYSFSIQASSGRDTVDATTLSVGTVAGVTPGAAGMQVNLSGGGSVSLADIKQII